MLHFQIHKIIIAMSSNITDESFSDDSLKVAIQTPKTKGKKLVRLTKRKQTYLQLNQSRLSSEFLKLKSDDVKEEAIHYPTRAGSTCEVIEASSSPRGSSNAEDVIDTIFMLPKPPKDSPKTSMKSHSRAPKRDPPELWPEFLCNKYLTHTQSEVENKLKIFKKRVEYGKRMSYLNKFNQKCLSKMEIQKTIKKTKPDESPTDRNNLEKLSGNEKAIVKSEKIKGSITSTSMGETTAAAGQKIQLKLEQLKIRHQKDKMIAEKIRNSTCPKQNEL